MSETQSRDLCDSFNPEPRSLSGVIHIFHEKIKVFPVAGYLLDRFIRRVVRPKKSFVLKG